MSSSSSSSNQAECVFIESMIVGAQHHVSEISNRQKTRVHVKRDREEAHKRLVQDYFSENARFKEKKFKRRFRMRKELFLRIVNDLEAYKTYFTQRWDGRGVKGLSPLQKCTAAIRQLGYGTAPDAWDEYLKMGEKTARDCLHKFCKYVCKLYGQQYLRSPSWTDICQLYEAHENRHGFPGMLGSIDCMHWEWDMCPIAWRRQFMRGDHPHPTLMLEAVASQDLWFWHAFFGVAGSNNDINVLHQSSLLNDLINEKAPESSFEVNGEFYQHGYYLADGIYPEWSVFVKSFTCPLTEKRKKFAQAQEGARKDIERAFGVLKKNGIL